eukprot:jgi/Astpho2/8087/Aster-03031
MQITGITRHLQYLPAFLAPASVLISLEGSVHGAEWSRWLLGLLPVPQAIMELPPINMAEVLYGQHPKLGDGLICTAVSLAGVLFNFVVMPSLDLLLGKDLHSRTEEELQEAAGDQGYRLLLWTWALLHCTLVAACCNFIGTNDVFPLAILGLTASLGASAGVGFAVSHELTHGRTRSDKFMAGLLLCLTYYMHWDNSHQAHHVKVATREDPASARLNESLYRFIPRSIAGNLADGVEMELNRLRVRKQGLLSLHNKMLLWVAAPTAVTASVQHMWGPTATFVLMGQALTAVVLLEAVNFVEHYGLQRKHLPSGRYEKVSKHHSWDANWLFTSSCLFQLQRHADHHLHAAKPYQILQHTPSAPQLPASYPAMVLLAAVPSLFFHVMNPRVAARQAGEQSTTSPE